MKNYLLNFTKVVCAALLFVVPTSISLAQCTLALNATTSGFSNSAVTSFTLSHTVSGSNTLLTVRVASNQSDPASVTWNGSSLTKLISVNRGTQYASFWYLVNPSSGTFNVVVTGSSSFYPVVGVSSYTGANQSTPFGTAVSGTFSSTIPSLNVSSNTGEFVLDVTNSLSTISPGSGQAQDYNISGPFCHGAGSLASGASSVTMNWSGLAIGCQIAVPLKPCTGPPPPPPIVGGSFDTLLVKNRIKVGHSIIIDGLSNTNSTNHIYTDATLPSELYIQSKPSPANYNTIINANNTGKVGIGVAIPLAKLHLSNGNILCDGTFGSSGGVPVTGPGTRMMWIPGKAAFRAGIVGANEWDDINIGPGSFAYGLNSVANGYYSFCTGTSNITSGDASFAAGTGNLASNIYSSAFGDNTISSGVGSASFGLFSRSESYASFVIGQSNITNSSYSKTGWVPTDPLFIIGNGTTAPSNALTVLKNGNIGIGPNTTSPTAKLNVNGNVLIGDPATPLPAGYNLYVTNGILAEKVKVALVTATNWSDYVFDEKYKLKSIKDLETFVKTNKHLPNIPSANEVVKDGIDVATMDAKLLEKIEELALYIIEQNKRIEALEKIKTK